MMMIVDYFDPYPLANPTFRTMRLIFNILYKKLRSCVLLKISPCKIVNYTNMDKKATLPLELT